MSQIQLDFEKMKQQFEFQISELLIKNEESQKLSDNTDEINSLKSEIDEKTR